MRTKPTICRSSVPASQSRPWDVLVVGGGNAGLCAAIAARQHGATVLVIEKAEARFRGGNSSLTMNLRFPHRTVDQLLQLVDLQDQTEEATEALYASYEPYTEADLLTDLVQTSNGRADRQLAHGLADGAWETVRWLRSLGHSWECKPTILPGAVPVRLKSGGYRLQQHNFAVAERLGIRLQFACSLRELVSRQGRVVGAHVDASGSPRTIIAHSTVLACGGYQANPSMRKRHLGAAWENVALRGVPYNTGDGHRAAEQVGAVPHGDYAGCHATPQNFRLAPYMLPGQSEESQDNSRYCFNYGVSVNRDGKRFFDEGEALPNFVYAKLGAAIVRQPGQLAFQVFDSATVGLLPAPYFQSRTMVRSSSLGGLARGLSIDMERFVATVEAFNAGAPGGAIDLMRLDSRRTIGVDPPKSNWAARIARAPFYGCPVRAGVTFTFGGIRIDPQARVLARDGVPIPGLYAAGEIVGGLFYGNYAGGSGLLAGAYFGRTAGVGAARARPAGPLRA